VELNDGGSFTTTLQTVTPSQNRTISFPDATGTLALVAGSTSQFVYNNAGAYAGVSTLTTDGTNVTLTGRFISSLNGAASAPPGTFTGTWFTGGTATTTKPQVLIEPTGATSTAWSTSGTGLGVNAASGFTGNLLDLQVNGSSKLAVNNSGHLTLTGSGASAKLSINSFGDNFLIDRLLLVQSNSQISSAGFITRTSSSNFILGASSECRWQDNNDGGVGAVSLVIRRDAANTLAQRNGTNAQTTRVYNTYTSDTNFERAKLQWDTNVLKVGTEKGADGGTARDMELQTDGTTRITLKANGAILFAGLPTSDPAVAGQLWNDGNTLKISAG
jgi:hypothetical protein